MTPRPMTRRRGVRARMVRVVAVPAIVLGLGLGGTAAHAAPGAADVRDDVPRVERNHNCIGPITIGPITIPEICL